MMTILVHSFLWRVLRPIYNLRPSTPSFDTFKKYLKSYLFQLSFSSL